VHPATLDQPLDAEAADHRLLESLGPVQDEQIGLVRRESPPDQIVQQRSADLGVFRRPGPQTQHVLMALAVHAPGDNQREIMEFLAVAN